jgi:hypothetical protein
MVDLFDKLKAKVEKKKEEKLGENTETQQLETGDSTIDESLPDGFVELDGSANIGKPAPKVIRATIVDLEQTEPVVEPLNLTKKEQPQSEPITVNLNKNVVNEKPEDAVIIPQVIKNTGAYSQSGIKEEVTTPAEPVASIKDVPQSWINKEVISKGILFVTFTSIVVDGIMYLYNSGLVALLILVAVSAFIQFILVTEYRKPTMR